MESPPQTFRPGSLAKSILFSTARIVTQSSKGSASGTGFIYLHVLPSERVANRGVPFLVTNRHVVEGAETGRVVFLQAADKKGEFGIVGTPYPLTIGDFSESWLYHPDPEVDLAMMDLSVFLQAIYETQGVRLFMRSSIFRDIPSASEATSIDAIEDIFMIGYPNSLMDEVNHLPIIRRGITATPFQVDYRGRVEFLIDASVFPGSSGSPVFLLDHQKPDTDTSKRLHLLGILSGGFFRVQGSSSTVRGDIPTALMPGEYQEMLDLGIVIKSRRLLEIIPLWQQHMTSLIDSREDDRQQAARLRDVDISHLIYKLQTAFRLRSWEDLGDYLHSTFAWHLVKKFKTSGLDPGERLCLYRLLQTRPEVAHTCPSGVSPLK